MKTKIIFIVTMVLLCFVWGLFVVEGYSATAKQNTKTSKGGNSGRTIYYGDCTDINPQAGTIIEITDIGNTWYDEQQIGSMGHVISVTPGGYHEVSWTYTNSPFPGTYRYVKSNCENPYDVWTGASNVDGGPSANVQPGYTNQSYLHDGSSVIIYHRSGGTPLWYTTLAVADDVCSDQFTRKFDIPDYMNGAVEPGRWPKMGIVYDSASNRDYMHIAVTESSKFYFTDCKLAPILAEPKAYGYVRCYIKDGPELLDTLICQCFGSGSTHTYKVVAGANGGGSFSTIPVFDSGYTISPIVVTSPVSHKVAIVYTKPLFWDGYEERNNVYYIESMNNGNDWVDGTNWPPNRVRVTDYDTTSFAYMDVAACYDYQDSLHIVWNTSRRFYWCWEYWDNPKTELFHWSKKTGITLIADANWSGTRPGRYNRNIAKPSLVAADPDYHGDSTYLYCTWTQFDTADNSANGYTNGDIYGCGSYNGGDNWGRLYNLTNTKTPGCYEGNCISEHWSSLATSDNTLHIQYICDRDAGAAVQHYTEGAWCQNSVMYLHLSQWPVPAEPRGTYRIKSPSEWYDPPLKITPGGSRTLVFTVKSIGNANLVYSVTTDDPCIQCNIGATILAPGASNDVVAIVNGSGSCNGTFIDGNIILTTNEGGGKIEYIPVQAIVSNAYYECPRDPLTYDTLENGALRFYVNANSQEWMHDISTFPSEVHEVFYNGGPFVATTESNDTLVGRYYGVNDQHTLAREYLHMNTYPTYWLEYSWNVAIEDIKPPMDSKWWWFEILHENVFFNTTATADLKNCVIKFITAERHDPPNWWPSQPLFTGYEDTYIGMMMDIDCPWDTLGDQSGRNRAGYDATDNIAWQRGWDYTGAHPSYNDYYAGIALAQGYQTGESTIPWGTYNLRNDVYLYPQSPWGWKDGDFYQLAKGNVIGAVQDPDLIVDRSQIVTARKITAGTDPKARASFTIVEAIGTTGLANMQARVAAARAWVANHPAIICGDANNSGVIEIGDIVTLISYLYKNGAAPAGPMMRGDTNNSGVIEIGDIVTLISYLYKNGPPPKCPGVW